MTVIPQNKIDAFVALPFVAKAGLIFATIEAANFGGDDAFYADGRLFSHDEFDCECIAPVVGQCRFAMRHKRNMESICDFVPHKAAMLTHGFFVSEIIDPDNHFMDITITRQLSNGFRAALNKPVKKDRLETFITHFSETFNTLI